MTKIVFELLKPIFDEFEQQAFVPNGRPRLAHYTSITNLENILRSNTLWLSNPLFMNDLNEVTFGVLKGVRTFGEMDLQELLSVTSDEAEEIRRSFNEFFEFDRNENVIDTYVFCLTEHDPSNIDGKLSMWRAYGDHGKGVALVFDFSGPKLNPQSSPLALTKVKYATEADQSTMIRDLLLRWANLLKGKALNKEDLISAGELAFMIVKAFALSTKHIGFKEEEEWRLIYLKEFDGNEVLSGSISYAVSEKGVQPKLKLSISSMSSLTGVEFNLEGLLEKVIVGPSHHANLTLHATKKMLMSLQKTELVNRTIQSKIPYRP